MTNGMTWNVYLWERGARRLIGQVIFAYGQTPFKTNKPWIEPIVMLEVCNETLVE